MRVADTDALSEMRSGATRGGWSALGAGGLMFVIALGIHASAIGFGPLGITAEGVAYVSAQRVLEGQIPYRDFWTIYAPGSFYLLAGVFSVFGSSVFVARLTSALLMGVVGLSLYGHGSRYARRWLAILIALVAIVALFPRARYYSTYPPLLAALLPSLLATTVYFRNGSGKWLFASGAACSLAIVFKHDVGCYVALATVLMLGARRLRGAPLPTGAVGLPRELG